MKRLLLALGVLCLLALTACVGGGGNPSTDDNSGSNTAPGSARADSFSTDVDTVNESQVGGMYQISFEFESNSCDTLSHVVTGRSKRELYHNFCVALEDSGLNRHCASSIRSRHYSEYCADSGDVPSDFEETVTSY